MKKNLSLLDRTSPMFLSAVVGVQFDQLPPAQAFRVRLQLDPSPFVVLKPRWPVNADILRPAMYVRYFRVVQLDIVAPMRSFYSQKVGSCLRTTL